jgi:hypothetical protein
MEKQFWSYVKIDSIPYSKLIAAYDSKSWQFGIRYLHIYYIITLHQNFLSLLQSKGWNKNKSGHSMQYYTHTISDSVSNYEIKEMVKSTDSHKT